MKTQIIHYNTTCEVEHPMMYNQFNGELQRKIDEHIKAAVDAILHVEKAFSPFNITYQAVRDMTSPNLKFIIQFDAYKKLLNFDHIGEYIEFEEIPAEGDNNKKPIKKKRNG